MIFVYDGTYEGFLTAAFRCFELKKVSNADVVTDDEAAALPFFEQERVENSAESADRVTAKLDKLGIADTVYSAWLSCEKGVDGAIVQYIDTAVKRNASPDGLLYVPHVKKVSFAAQHVGREARRFIQFLRFVKVPLPQGEVPLLTDGKRPPDLYVADIEPQYDILPRLAYFFTSRFNDQRFLIRDRVRYQTLVWDTENWHISTLPEFNGPPLPGDADFEDLWRTYFDHVAIPWRVNPKLQQHHVPLQYRKYMTEFRGRKGYGGLEKK